MKAALRKTESLVKGALAGEPAEQALTALSECCQILRQRVGKNLVKAVSPDDLQAARSLQMWAHRLAQHLSEKDEDRLEEIAWQLRCSPILALHGHQRHLVGPAMLDWADCNARQGNQEKADMLYNAVIQDFRMLLALEPVPSTESFTALDSLKKALERHSQEHPAELEQARARLRQWEKMISL
jgi:hypothetical protein